MLSVQVEFFEWLKSSSITFKRYHEEWERRKINMKRAKATSERMLCPILSHNPQDKRKISKT